MGQVNGLQLNEKEVETLGGGLVCFWHNLKDEREALNTNPKPYRTVEHYTELIKHTEELMKKVEKHGMELHTRERLQGDQDKIKVPGHVGYWHVIAETNHIGRKLYLLEHTTHGDSAASVIIDDQGALVLEDVWNGWNDLELLEMEG